MRSAMKTQNKKSFIAIASMAPLVLVAAYMGLSAFPPTENKMEAQLLATEKVATSSMVYVKGGKLHTVIPYTEQPVTKQLKSFYIDKSPVTVAEFQKVAKAKKYITEAERFGNSGVFDIEQHGWAMADSVSYRYPLGKKNGYKAPDNHPATQVSWNDAKFYCECLGKRLPTDAEWEFAAKSGQEAYKNTYSWGNAMVEKGKHKTNYWQGTFPDLNTQEDGFLYTSPVGHFGTNPIGLTDMGGNVWQWCQDDIGPTPAEAKEDPSMRKVLRGGSFLCDPDVCHGFKVHGRSASTPETGLPHVGFRCVKEASK